MGQWIRDRNKLSGLICRVVVKWQMGDHDTFLDDTVVISGHSVCVP